MLSKLPMVGAARSGATDSFRKKRLRSNVPANGWAITLRSRRLRRPDRAAAGAAAGCERGPAALAFAVSGGCGRRCPPPDVARPPAPLAGVARSAVLFFPFVTAAAAVAPGQAPGARRGAGGAIAGWKCQ